MSGGDAMRRGIQQQQLVSSSLSEEMLMACETEAAVVTGGFALPVGTVKCAAFLLQGMDVMPGPFMVCRTCFPLVPVKLHHTPPPPSAVPSMRPSCQQQR